MDEAGIILRASQPPNARQNAIDEYAHALGFEDDPYLTTFGMKVSLEPETVNARVIEPPELQFETSVGKSTGGSWSLRGKRIVDGAVLHNWGIVVTANMSEEKVHEFVSKLIGAARKMGLTVEDDQPCIVRADHYAGTQAEDLMRMCFGTLEERDKGEPQLIVVVKEVKTDGLYDTIKRVSDTVLGVPSQCILASNARRATSSSCANLCLKINMKLGGTNWTLQQPVPLIQSAPTIIIGADVEYARSGVGSRPSIAAVVASVDQYPAHFAARVAAQSTSSDIYQLPNMLRELVLAYYARTKRKPERMLYYRNGVSEGQQFDVLQAEMRALVKAFKMIWEHYRPPVTFVVANKRHHLRAFPVESQDADHMGNAVAGTVIDAGVVDPHRFDFYSTATESSLSARKSRVTTQCCTTRTICRRMTSRDSPTTSATLFRAVHTRWWRLCSTRVWQRLERACS